MPGSMLSPANAPQARSSSLSSNSRSNRGYFWKLLAVRLKKKLQKSFCLFTEDPLRSTTGKKSVDLPQQPGVTTTPESMHCSYSVVPHLMLERMENMICDSCLWVIVIVNKKPNGYWNLPTLHTEKMRKGMMTFPSMAALFSRHRPVCQIGISNSSTAIIHMPLLKLWFATHIISAISHSRLLTAHQEVFHLLDKRIRDQQTENRKGTNLLA